MRIVIGHRLIGIATGGQPFRVGANKVFVDCCKCDQSFQMFFDSPSLVDRYTDAQFIRAGQKHGWRISARGRSYCPVCKVCHDR